MSDILEASHGLDRTPAPSTGGRAPTTPFAIDLQTARTGRDGELMTVRLADCEHQRSAASMLLNRMYSRRGYGSDHQLPRHESSASFSAAVGERLIGTLTLTADSAEGLSLDKTFADELALFRSAPGTHICELTRLAFDTSGRSLPYLAALFHIIFIYGTRRYGCTDLFIEVNPRHARFYESMLLFRRIGEVKTNLTVNAPAQLMWLKVSEVRRLIDEHAGRGGAGTRSLYPYFYSANEEQGIAGRLFPFGRDPLGRPGEAAVPHPASAC